MSKVKSFLTLFFVAVITVIFATLIVLHFSWVKVMIWIVAIQLVNLGEIIYKIINRLI